MADQTWNPSFGFSDPQIKVNGESDRIAFAGADLNAFIGSIYVGTLAAITVSVTCEVMPIYTCGDRSPKCFVRGKRGIAGSMTFQQFNKHAVIEALVKNSMQIESSTATIGNLLEAMGTNAQYKDTSMSSVANTYGDLSKSGGYNLAGNTVNNAIAFAQIEALSRKFAFVDQLPPFDMTLAFANEQGAFSWMALEKVQFVNEGYGFTQDDLNNEMAVTYVARSLQPFTDKSPTEGSAGANSLSNSRQPI